MKRRALAAACLLLASHGVAVPDSSLPEQQEQARQQQAELRARIKTLQSQIDRQEASRQDAGLALKESEAAISEISRRLAQLQVETAQVEAELSELEDQVVQQQAHLGSRRQELTQQLRAQYTSGLSPWTALLSGDDPRTIGRDLSYLGYVSAAQTEAVREVSGAIARLDTLRKQTHAKKEELQTLAQQTSARHAELDAQKAERQKVL